MYDWPLENLTDWELNRAPNFTRQEYHALLLIEKVEVKIAFAKVSVNIAIQKLQDALKALPWPPHEVQVWCRKINPEFGMLLDDILSARKVDPDLRQIWAEDHPEYAAYFNVAMEYNGRKAALRMLNNQHAKITAGMLQKKKKKTAQSKL